MGAKGDSSEELHDEGEKKAPRPLPPSSNTEKEPQDRGNYFLQVLNLYKLIICANGQKSLGSAVPMAVWRNN